MRVRVTVEGNAVSQLRSPTGVYAVKCWRADIAHESSSPPKSGVVGALFFGRVIGRSCKESRMLASEV
ncbi:hypothetical protein pipiens_006181 [Culex pipiens pipiens]|uniref:Uncharacterized protein n=1 Tax=Culex pipiens pipiens TaxID=38569 RepID=A0ABD1DRN3_CULPP